MLVSVVIPAYNASKFIEKTLKSVLAQTHRDLEIVVVDDGSTDETVARVGALAARDPRIILHSQENQGASVARNLGIEKSTGALIAFLDADDLWSPVKIEKQHELMLNSAVDVALIYTFSRMIDTEDLVQGYTGACVAKRGNVFHDLLIYNFIGNGSVAMVRRSCLPQPEPFDPTQRGNDDFYFYLRVASRYKIDVVEDFLVGYRWDTGVNKSSNLERQISSYDQAIRKISAANPGIPQRIIRWGRAGFLLSHAQTTFKRKQFGTSIALLTKGIVQSPTYLLSEPFVRTLTLGVRWSRRKLKGVKAVPRPYFNFNAPISKVYGGGMTSERAICYVADKAFILPTLVAARHIRRFARTDKARVFIFAVDEEDGRIREMNAFMKPYAVEILPLDSRHFSDTDCTKIEKTHVSMSTLGRFFIADLLPESCRTLTYMDGDTWAVRDVSRLVEWDIAEGKLGAVEDGTLSFGRYEMLGSGHKIRKYLRGLNIGFSQGYFNAGILHSTRRTWRTISSDAFNFFCSNPDLCLFRDQSALNAVVGDRRINLSLQWNFQSFFKFYHYDRVLSPSVYHFIGSLKPWLGATYPWREFTPAFETGMKELEPLGILKPVLAADKLQEEERLVLTYDWKIRNLFHLRRLQKKWLVDRYIASSVLND